MMETIASIARRAREAGKHAAIYVVDPNMAGRFVSMGYRFMALGSEPKYIALGAETLLKAARGSIG